MKKIFFIKVVLTIVLIFFQSNHKSNAQPIKQKSLEVIYKSAIAYAGSTQYFFEDIKTKNEIIVSVENVSIDGKRIVPKIPKNMLKISKNKDGEGLPEANPKLVGKKFLVLYDKEDNVIQIKQK
jgi:hypothetical protein